MKKKKIIFLLTSLMCLNGLPTSCKKGDSNNDKWAYTKEDMSAFMELEAKLTDNGDKTATFSSDTDIPFLSEKIDEDDVIVFDSDKVVEELKNQNKDYADYSVLKAAAVPVSNIKNLDDNDGFDITFQNENGGNYGMLLHSSVTPNNSYVMVNKYEAKTTTTTQDPQKTFEESYASKGFSWEDGGKFIFEIVTNIGMIVAGGASDNPAAAYSGFVGLISSICNNLTDSVSLKDVMSQLKETDKKIDELSSNIEKNTTLLADEIVRTGASVDQTNLNTLNITLNDFANNSLTPIANFNRNLADEINNYYRDFVQKEQTIGLNLSKNKNGEYQSMFLGQMDASNAANFSLTISDFTNAKAHLASHNNIAESGFMDELYKDIDQAIAKKTDIPEGCSKENLRKFVASMIYEKFTKDYFSAHKDKAQEYRNLMIDYAQRLMGTNGKTSVLNTYLSRLELIYNFGSEIKDTLRSLSVNLLKNLDFNTARAGQACLFAEITSQELETNYKSCRTAVQKFYTDSTKIEDNYSFIVSAPLTGGFYKASYTPSYSNLGNHPNLKVDFKFEKVEKNDINVSTKEDDVSKHNSITPIQHNRMSTRWTLMRKAGATTSNVDYLHYLVDAGIIDKSSLSAADYLFSLKQMPHSGYRILTSDRAERNLNSSDRSTSLNCVAKGNPDGDYYNVGSNYNYQSSHESDSWFGKTFECNFVDASAGNTIGKQKICTWARYSEGHWYWSNDEHYAFSNNSDSYFFCVDIVTK